MIRQLYVSILKVFYDSNPGLCISLVHKIERFKKIVIKCKTSLNHLSDNIHSFLIVTTNNKLKALANKNFVAVKP